MLPLLTGLLCLCLPGKPKKMKAYLAGSWWWVFLVTALPWYVYVSLKYGRQFLWEFFVHDNWHRFLYAEHGSSDKWYFYPAIILLGMLPWTFCLLNIRKQSFERFKNEFIFLFSWIGSALLIFTPAHSKLSSYILPAFPPIAILTGIVISEKAYGWRRNFIAGLYPAMALLLLMLIPKITKVPVQVQGKALAAILLLVVFNAAAGYISKGGGLEKLLPVNAGIWVVLICIFYPAAYKFTGAFTNSDIKKIADDLNYGKRPILCDKYSVRGVYFYTNNPVEVLSEGNNPFWSSHPVKVVSTDQEIRDCFAGTDKLLCVVNKKELERLEKFSPDREKDKIIYNNMDRFVVLFFKQ